MPHVVIEKDGFNLEIQVDGSPVLELGLDLTQSIVIELSDLIELLEESSDNVVEYVDLNAE